MEENKPGGILLMSSLAGLMGMQFIAPYAASKAFAWNLAEALSNELKPYSIDVTACIAGATTTEAYLNTNPQPAFFKPQVLQPQEVANSALKKLGKKTLYISGFWNRLNYFFLTGLMPRNLAAKMANKTMQKMFPQI
jgi:short-subunit dehydrogenase